jgi:ChrR Cupin-like domain
VFHDVWQRAAGYSTADGTVLGWIMNLARARIVEQPRADPAAQNRVLKDALRFLSAEERAVLEGAYFSGRDSAPGRARSALHKLARVLGAKTSKEENTCRDADLVCAYLLQELSAGEERTIEAHFASCWQCRHELETVRPVVDTFVAWPTDVLRPPAPLQARLARRIAGGPNAWLVLPQGRPEPQPEWEDVAPGISVKILASDPQRHMVSMLVHLVPGGEYPPHTHAGVEELHLLEGELWIDERKLHAGDYNRAEPGTGDKRVWSETGCSCVLVTSTRDVLS